MAAMAARAMASLDLDGSKTLDLAELTAAAGYSDGKLSLASLDPGTGGLLSIGTLWNGFIAALVLFFVWSIVEQVGLSQQAEEDDAELSALEASLKKKTK